MFGTTIEQYKSHKSIQILVGYGVLNPAVRRGRGTYRENRLFSGRGLADETLAGQRGLAKNSGVSGTEGSDIPFGIRGLLPHMLCIKTQQP